MREGTADVTVGVTPRAFRGDSASSLYRRLRADVLAGAFGAGDLLQETLLTGRYGLSRTPVREALARLEQDGLLERASRGYRIRAGTPQDVLDVYQARIALESVAAANAASRRSDLDLARLEGLHRAAGQAVDPTEERRQNAAWHEALWEASRNPTVREILDRLTAQLRIYDRDRVESAADLAQSRVEHEAVMVALRAGDASGAAAAIGAHLERSREVRLDAFAVAEPGARRDEPHVGA